MESFDEVHVVSDLHLGGMRGQQIFKGGEILAAFIESLAQADRRIAFVINGDFIDFLAEPGATYFDPRGAPDKVERISRDPAFNGVWGALKKFVAKDKRQLVIVVGNHDLELAMPRVQTTIIELLARESPAARGRIIFSTMGAGFAACVGQARVLCLHGNEADLFNITDYERLRREARDEQFGWPPKPWVPNPGTQLVIDIMNGIKKKRPFIDLLKPETDAVIPVLFALGDVDVERILGFLEVALRLGGTAARKAAGLLSDEDADALAARDAGKRGAAGRVSPRAQAASKLLDIVEQTFKMPAGGADDDLLGRLLDEAEERFQRGEDPLSLPAAEGEATLGLWNLTKAAVRWRISRLQGNGLKEALRVSLQHLAKDETFAIDHRDETFQALDNMVPIGPDFVVAGHTHLERSHPRAGGYYINTGTWARLIRIDSTMLADEHAFTPCFEALQKETMEALDEGEAVVLHRPAVASIIDSGGVVRGVLNHVALSNGKIELRSAGAS